MPQILFALLLSMATETVDTTAPMNQCWLHGRWLHVAVTSPSTTIPMAPVVRKCPRERHILLFQPDGELRRYSPQKGWVRLLMDFSVTENSAVLSSHTNTPISLTAQMTQTGLLKVHMPTYGDFYYRKLSPKTPLSSIDFTQAPTEILPHTNLFRGE